MAARTTVRKSGTSRSPGVSMKDRVTALEGERDKLAISLREAYSAADVRHREARMARDASAALDDSRLADIESHQSQIKQLRSKVTEQATVIRQNRKYIDHLQLAIDSWPQTFMQRLSDAVNSRLWRLHRRFG